MNTIVFRNVFQICSMFSWLYAIMFSWTVHRKYKYKYSRIMIKLINLKMMDDDWDMIRICIEYLQM